MSAFITLGQRRYLIIQGKVARFDSLHYVNWLRDYYLLPGFGYEVTLVIYELF